MAFRVRRLKALTHGVVAVMAGGVEGTLLAGDQIAAVVSEGGLVAVGVPLAGDVAVGVVILLQDQQAGAAGVSAPILGVLPVAFGGLGGLARRLQENLDLFRIWYNPIRFHNNLDGRTPGQAWDRKVPRSTKQPAYFSEWDGVLTGFYFRDG